VAEHIDHVNVFAGSHGRQLLQYGGCVYVSGFASELYAGNIDVLLVFNGAECNLDCNRVFELDQEVAVKDALANGKLKKLMVW
jgi:hypothetical protein